MKKKLSLLNIKHIVLILISSVLSLTTASAQVTATIGTGTTSGYTYGAIYRSSASSAFDYSRYHYVFTAAELSAAGITPGASLSQLAWYFNNTNLMSGTGNATLKIHVKNSSATAVVTDTWASLISGSTLVVDNIYNTTNNLPGVAGWWPLAFSTPVVYTGASLEVSVDWDCSAIVGNPTTAAFAFLYGTTPGVSVSYVNNSTLPTSTTTTASFRPNTQFVHTPAACPGVTGISGTNFLANTADFTWTAEALATGYNWKVVAAGAGSAATAVASGLATTNSVTATSLSPVTNYDFYVQVNCGAGTSVFAGPYSFLTGCVTTLNGTYTIGGMGADFANFSAAALELNTCGITGPVVFNIAPGIYAENIELGQIVGSSSVNTITFNGASAATTILTYNGSGTNYATITLNGSDYITFKNLTIENTKTISNAWGVLLTNQADNNTIDSAIINIDPTTTISTMVGVVSTNSYTSMFTSGNNANNTTISNTEFNGGYYGVRFYGLSSSIPNNINNKVENCTFTNLYYYAIYYYYQGEAVIKGNTVNALRGTFAYGLYSYYGRNGLIEGNTVVDAPGGYALYMAYENQTASGPNLRSNILNNMFGTTLAGDGIYLTNADYINVYHNSVKAETDQALWVATTANDLDIRNNIFVSDVEPVDFDAVPAATDILDYNIYYNTTGGNISLSTGAYASLAAWQAADATHNVNSIQGNPLFAGTNNLHLLGILANNVGTPIASITEDIDGQVRSATTPDIGADEFTPALCFPPTGMTSNLLTLTSADLLWTTGGASTWLLEYGLAGFTPGTGVGTAVTVMTNDSLNISGLMPNTNYDWYVRDYCGVGDTSIWTSVNTFYTGYCVPSSSTSTTYINNFTTSSGNVNISNLASGYTTGGYQDNFATHYVEVGAGTSFDYNYDFVGGSLGSAIWIDWNNNLVFEASERVFNTTGYTTAPFSGTIAVALGQALGNYRMRIMVDYNGSNPTNPCITTGTRVEVEDYKITVVAPPTCFAPTALTGTTTSYTSADLQWTSNTASAWVLEYGVSGFAQGAGTELSLTDTFTTLSLLMPSTNYDFYVREYCGGTDSSAWAGPVNFFTGSCTPAPSSVDGSGIINVTMGTINNTTVAEPGNYGNYTALSTDAGQGVDFPVAITLNTGFGYTYNLWAFVDWNQDTDFDDADEQMYLGESPAVSQTTYNAVIPIPANASLGSYIVRLGGSDSGLGSTTPSNPCYTGSFGSFEDYTLNVVSCNIPNTVIPTALCMGDTVMVGTTEVTMAGMYNDTLVSYAGCDSVLVYDVTMLMPTASAQNLVLCQGTPLTLGGGTVVTAGGVYTEVFMNAVGCDSTVTYTVTMNVSTSSTTNVHLCDGATYTLPSGTVVSVANTYVLHATNAAGCDSTANYVVTTGMSTAETLDVTFCAGGSVTLIDGSVATAAGTQTVTTVNASGCDNVITYNITELPTAMGTMTESICAGSSFAFDGQMLTMAGVYTMMATSSNGCDSIVELTLTVLPVSSSTTNAAICEGASYMFDGQSLTMAGTYTMTAMSANGCDSVATLNLVVNATSNTAMEVTICEGDSYSFDGQMLTTGGVYTSTGMTSNGCDSIVTLTLTVDAAADVTSSATICRGDSYMFGTQVLTAAGVYTEMMTNANGCEYTETLTLTVVNAVSTSVDVLLCGTELTYTLANGTVVNAAGIYTETMMSANGCDSTITYNVSTCVGIFTVENNVAMVAYPNPAQDKLNVKFESRLSSENTIRILNVLGQSVYNVSNFDGLTLEVNTSNLTSGVYYINVTSDYKTSVVPFTVSK